MTTQEWHEADQDDADRVREWPAQDAQEPHCGHVETPCGCDNSPDPYQAYDAMRAQRDAAQVEIERLQNELHGVLCDRAEAWATIARLTYDRNHPYGEVAS